MRLGPDLHLYYEALCQYCDAPRTHVGYYGLDWRGPVSLCGAHLETHGADFWEARRVVVDGVAARLT